MVNKKFDIIKKLSSIVLLVSCVETALAAPLPNGTLLEIETGTNPDLTGKCSIGSCWGMEVSPGFYIWFMLGPGIDGGIVVGKNQLSGGQEVTPPGEVNPTPGDMTGTWVLWGVYGTLYADQSQNIYSDTSNNGETVINDLHIAWNTGEADFGGGTINDYSITLDGNGQAYYTLDYTGVMKDGGTGGLNQFAGVRINMILRSSITIPDGNTSPVVNDQDVTGYSGESINWTPLFTSDIGDVHTCAIIANGGNGNATVKPDCTEGSYTSGAGYEGVDSFTYSVADQYGLTGEGTVNVYAVARPTDPCVDNVSLKQVTTTGGGQSVAVNASLTTTFFGHIVTEAGLTSSGKNTVKICPGTSVWFSAVSSVGDAFCMINGAATSEQGNLSIGDKLLCTNKPDGSDVDRFSIRSDQ